MRAIVLRFKILYLNEKKIEKKKKKDYLKKNNNHTPIMVWLMTAGIMVAGDGRYNGG